MGPLILLFLLLVCGWLIWDITPLGFAKVLASIQALIGFLLPAAFVVSGLASIEKNR
jgi:hypothetical protein